MFGRDDEIDQVVHALGSSDSRLVSLTGRGGVGKTRLALEVAHRFAASGDPTTVVSLAGVTAPPYVLAEIASALEVTPTHDVELSDAVIAALGPDPHVLVLDNFEHLLDCAPIVNDLLVRCPEVRVLVTSQAPLRLRSERVISLSPLPVPDPEMLDPVLVAEQPTVAIYVERASAVDHRFTLCEDNVAAVVELCRRLEGLPLAIELAAARAASLPPNEILRRLDDSGLDLLRRNRVDAPARHHGLRAAIAWTYGLLSTDQQQLLRRVAACTGTFDLDAVIELDGCADAAEALDRFSALVDFHLVDPTGATGSARYSMPTTIGSFARSEGARLGEAEAIDAHHRAMRVRQCQVVAEADGVHEHEGLQQRLAADHQDIQASLLAALDQELVDDALDLVRGLTLHWEVRGYPSSHEELVERAIELADRQGADPGRLGRVLTSSAILGLRITSKLEATELLARLERAEQLARSGSDDDLLVRVLSTWAFVAPMTGDIARAATSVAEGLEVASRPGNERYRPRMQVWAGMLAGFLGDEDRAIELGRAALDEARRRGDQGTIVCTVVLLDPLRSRHAEALADLPSNEEAIEIARRVGMPFYEALLLPKIVWDEALAGNISSAARAATETLAAARTMPGSPIVAFQLMAVTVLALANGDADRAAWLHGNIRAALTHVGRSRSEEQIRVYEHVVDTTRAALGDERFEATSAAGASRTLAEGVDLALACVEAIAKTDPEAERPEDEASVARLTLRQLEVLGLLAQGHSNKEIARQLGITAKSVMHHTTAIYQATGARGRSEATAWAFRNDVTT